MFSKPKNGWSEISWNGIYIGRCSYIEAVPLDFIEYCVTYLYNYYNGIQGNFEFIFDAEGWSVGIVEIDGSLFSYDTRFNRINNLTELRLHCDYIPNGVKILLEDAVKDFKNDFKDWVLFLAFTENEILRYSNQLEYYINIAEEYITKTWSEINENNRRKNQRNI